MLALRRAVAWLGVAILADVGNGSPVEVVMSGRLTETCVNRVASLEGKLGFTVVQDIAKVKGWHSSTSSGEVSDDWARSAWQGIQEESEAQRAACFGIQTKDASPIMAYVDMLEQHLSYKSNLVQVPLCFFLLAVGMAWLWDGPAAWRATFTLCTALLGALLARHEALAWDLTPNIAQEAVWMLQAGLAVALAVHVGYEGSQVIFGVLLGIVSAYGMGAWAREMESVFPGFAVLWYVLGGIAGFVSYTILRPLMLALIASLAGGALAVAACGALLSRLWAGAAGAVDALPGHAWGLPLPQTPAIHGAGELLGVGSHYAIPWHCGCAMIAAVVRCSMRKDWLAIVALVGSIGFELGVSASCEAGWLSGRRCPGSRGLNWQWMLVGDVLWIALSSVAAWRQLQRLAAWEVTSFWQALVPWAAGEDDEEVADDLVARSPDGRLRGRGDRRDVVAQAAPPSAREADVADVAAEGLPMPPLDAGLAAHWNYARGTLERAWASLQGDGRMRRIAVDSCCSAGTQPGARRDSGTPGRGYWS